MPKNKAFSTLTWSALILTAFLFSGSVNAKKNGFGLGVIIGEPTGPTFKVWTGNNTAIDGALAWSLGGNDDVHLHMDYLIHDFGIATVEKGRLPLYYGIGGRIKFNDGRGEDQFGVRVPVGLAYLFANSPMELFFEIVPIVDLVPDTELDFNGGIGIRYYFGK